MSAAVPALAPSLHPTILIGYGSYGRKVLRRLLVDAEGHGLLIWEDPPSAGSPSERRLKDLALIHVSDQSDGEEIESYMAKDLFRLIRTSSLEEVDFKQAVVGTKGLLLDEAARSADPARLRLGLDVIVFAQPTSLEALGTLERILPPVMQDLASDVSLKQPGPGSARINFSLVFDFENYWDRDAAGSGIRRETVHSIQRWERRMQEGLPAFGRIYLLDGHTLGGNRNETLRIEELTLFLEFLLFAGLRDHPGLRSLYQRENDRMPPLGTFGVRLIERSHGLLTRLVAAYFGLGWLGYMAGSEARAQARNELRGSLTEFQPASLDLSGLRSDLSQRLASGIATVEEELARLNVDDEDWPRQFREQLSFSTLKLKSDLDNWVGDQAQVLVETRLKGVAQRLEEVVSGALHHETAPAPLGTVLQELKELQHALRSEFTPAGSLKEDSSQAPGALEAIDQIHRDYRVFKHSQVNPNRLADWWILLAIVISAAWTPIVLEAIEELPVPGHDASSLLSAGYNLLTWLGKPIIVAPLLVLAAWVAGKYGFQPNFQSRIERGLLVFVHRDRGWFTSKVRDVLHTGSFRDSLENYAREVFENMARRLRGVVFREVSRVLEKLESRRRELDWLRNELRVFLSTYGLDPDKAVDSWRSVHGHRPGYHSSLEEVADFLRLLKLNPPTVERFESMQARLRPFTGWERRYCSAFLYPVVFLEQLSREYRDESSGGSHLQPEQLSSSLSRFSGFSCGMQWDAGEGPGTDVVESYCVMPEAWRALAGIEGLLSKEGITRQHVVAGSDSSRAYLLRFQLRVSSERLQDARET